MDTTKITYRPNGGQVFRYLLMTVYAPDRAAADWIAQPDDLDGWLYALLVLDSAEAQVRLGVFGDYVE